LSADDGPSRIHSALLVPSQSKTAIIPLSPVLLTSNDVQVTINPNARSVYITSPSRGGLLSLQTLSPDALVTSLTAALPSLISIPDPDNRYAPLLANPDRAPTRLFVIPLSAESSASAPSALSLPLSPILSHIKFLSNDSSSHFSLSNPTRFISTSADHIQLNILDFGGARFSFSPVYDLVKPDGDVRLSIHSKHNRITSITNSLLTPPPSPPLSAVGTETQPEDNDESLDQLPHVDHQSPQPLESGQSTPSPPVGSGQVTPRPRPATNGPTGPTDPTPRPATRIAIIRLIHFVLRILALYTRILSRIILSIFARLHISGAPKREPVATPKVKTVELDDGQAETKPTSVSSVVHTPLLLTPRAGTPRREHSGVSTPISRDDPLNLVGQNLPGITETLEAVTTRIVPEFTTKVGEQEKPQEDLGGSYAHEPKPDPDCGSEKSGHNEKWEVVHRPGIVFELAALPEGEDPPKIKPIRLTLDGAESVVKGIKIHLDDAEVTDISVVPLTGTGQVGLWAVEVPRMTSDLTTLRIS